MTAPTLADLRYAFFGAGEGESVSDAEYAQLLAMYQSGITLGMIGAGSHPPINASVLPLPREDTVRADVPMATGVLALTYFRSPSSMTVANVILYSGTTAAGATPTIVRAGIYAEETNRDLTLIASIANDTTIFAAANSQYIRALTTPVGIVAGKTYAMGILVVTAAAAPTGNGVITPVALVNRNKSAPGVACSLGAQANLPATALFASIAGSVNRHYSEIF